MVAGIGVNGFGTQNALAQVVYGDNTATNLIGYETIDD
jgi:hypothetical protein